MNFSNNPLEWTPAMKPGTSITVWQVTAHCIDYTFILLIDNGDRVTVEVEHELSRPLSIDSLNQASFHRIDVGPETVAYSSLYIIILVTSFINFNFFIS